MSNTKRIKPKKKKMSDLEKQVMNPESIIFLHQTMAQIAGDIQELQHLQNIVSLKLEALKNTLSKKEVFTAEEYDVEVKTINEWRDEIASIADELEKAENSGAAIKAATDRINKWNSGEDQDEDKTHLEIDAKILGFKERIINCQDLSDQEKEEIAESLSIELDMEEVKKNLENTPKPK